MAPRPALGPPRGPVSYRPLLPVARLAIAACQNPLQSPPAAERILVLRLGAVGDVVRTLPAVSRLRAAYPGAEITWLVEPAAASAVQGQPWVDEVLVFPRPALAQALRRRELARLSRELRPFLRDLRRRRFDLALDFHSLLRSALLARLSGARRRVGYAPPFSRELAHWLATDRALLSPRRASRFERNAALVDYLGVRAAPAPLPFAVDSRARARMEALLAPGRVPVVLHPGSSDGTPYKRYPARAYAAVARALAAQEGLPSVVSFGPGRDDRALARAVVEASEGAARLAPETRSLPELAVLLASCRLFIGGDTGPLHLASLVGTPVVQLLGPTDPVENAPWPGTPSRTLRVPLACSPCRRGCPAALCMRSIPPEAVAAAARELLTPARAQTCDAGAVREAG
jgi:ADP-heptose:LPS heptosyltransferase